MLLKISRSRVEIVSVLAGFRALAPDIAARVHACTHRSPIHTLNYENLLCCRAPDNSIFGFTKEHGSFIAPRAVLLVRHLGIVHGHDLSQEVSFFSGLGLRSWLADFGYEALTQAWLASSTCRFKVIMYKLQSLLFSAILPSQQTCSTKRRCKPEVPKPDFVYVSNSDQQTLPASSQTYNNNSSQ